MVNARYMARTPEEVGIDSERLGALFARARRDVERGMVRSAQVAVARQGKIAGVRTFGSAVQGGVEQPATDRTLYRIFSATKGVVAAAIWRLFEEKLLSLDERIADIIPEFGTNGKDIVTVEHVLLHTGGFPYAPYRPEHWGSREKLVEAFSHWRLDWEPGSRFEYHATAGHWVLAEIINRRTGVEYRRFIREQITTPIGVDELFIGMPADFDLAETESLGLQLVNMLSNQLEGTVAMDVSRGTTFTIRFGKPAAAREN